MTCVCSNGHSESNTQYFYMGIVQFESQEYCFGTRVQVFVKVFYIRLFLKKARFVMKNCYIFMNKSVRLNHFINKHMKTNTAFCRIHAPARTPKNPEGHLYSGLIRSKSNDVRQLWGFPNIHVVSPPGQYSRS